MEIEWSEQKGESLHPSRFVLTFQSTGLKKSCLLISSTPSGPAPNTRTHTLIIVECGSEFRGMSVTELRPKYTTPFSRRRTQGTPSPTDVERQVLTIRLLVRHFTDTPWL